MAEATIESLQAELERRKSGVGTSPGGEFGVFTGEGGTSLIDKLNVELENRETGSIGDVVTGAVSGAREAGQSVLNLINRLGNELERRIPTGAEPGENFFELPEVDKPTSAAGNITKGVMQFLTGFIPFLRATKFISKGGGLGRELVRGEVAANLAEQTVFDPKDPRLSDLIQQFPDWQNSVTEFLQTKDNDTEAEARMKMVLESTGIGAAVVPFLLVLKGFRRGASNAVLEEAPVKVNSPPIEQAPVEQVLGGTPDSAINLSRSEVEKLIEAEARGNHEKLVEALGSEEAAKEFNRLDRAANSQFPETADAAIEKLHKLTDNFTPEQERLVYGIGETGLNVEELKVIEDALTRVEFFSEDTVNEIAHEVVVAVSKLDTQAIEAVQAGGGSAGKQASFIILREGLRVLKSRGIQNSKLEDLLVGSMMRRGIEKEDALFLFESLRKAGNTPRGATPKSTKAIEDKTALPETESSVEDRFVQPVHKNVTNAAEELLLAGKVIRDKDRLISDQIMELLTTERISGEQFNAILAKHDLTSESFAEVWRVDVKKSAQTLQMLSAVEAKVNKMMGNASAADEEILKRAQGMDADAQTQGFWRRLDNVRRGLLVTQLATAMRNAETQVGRIGIDVYQKVFDKFLIQLFPKAVKAGNPIDAFGTLSRLFSKNKKASEDILNRFPKEHDDLFFRYSSDLNRAGAGTGAMGKAEKTVQALNVANRFQEFLIRRAVFMSSLDTRLKKAGLSLEEITANNKIGTIDRKHIKGAVEDALEMTWAMNFSPFAKGPEGVAGSFIQLVNKMPGIATLPIPFPRFLMNSMKFQFEHSPAGFLKLLSPAERAKVAAGDTKTISRALVGSSMLYAAKQFRDSDLAGEKWWEMKTPDGSTIDLRPFNPFVSYLFVADVIKRSNEGTLQNLTTKDLAFGVLSSNVRAGAGLFIVDSFIEGLAGLRSGEKALTKLKEFGGSVASGFLVPLQQIRDLYAQYDIWASSGEENKIRSTATEPFLGQFKTKLPGVAQGLPELESPTREAPIRRQNPLLRQLTGLSISPPKNPAERELDRLGFTRREIVAATGSREADQLIAKHMGPLVERVLSKVVTAKRYKKLSNDRKGEFLRMSLIPLRRQAMKKAIKEDPKLFQQLREQRQPRRRRQFIEGLQQ